MGIEASARNLPDSANSSPIPPPLIIKSNQDDANPRHLIPEHTHTPRIDEREGGQERSSRGRVEVAGAVAAAAEEAGIGGARCSARRRRSGGGRR